MGEGIFVWHLNGNEKRCLLLSSLGQPIATGTVSYSFRRTDAATTTTSTTTTTATAATTASSEATTTSSTADPLELEGFVLAYEGAVPENTDSPLRFGTAFDTSARLATYTNIPNADCASHCISDDACEGIFVWHLNGNEKRCLLLSSLGQPIATGTVSYSFRRTDAATTTTSTTTTTATAATTASS